MSVSVLPASAPSPDGNMVPARVDGAELRIPCTAWCTTDHVGDNPKFLGDVDHSSTPTDVAVPVGTGEENILMGWITQSPYGSSDRGTVFAFDATGSGEVAELTKTKAISTLDQLAAHIDALRVVVAQMP